MSRKTASRLQPAGRWITEDRRFAHYLHRGQGNCLVCRATIAQTVEDTALRPLTSLDHLFSKAESERYWLSLAHRTLKLAVRANSIELAEDSLVCLANVAKRLPNGDSINADHNLAVVCSRCNAARGDLEWRRFYGRFPGAIARIEHSLTIPIPGTGKKRGRPRKIAREA